VKNLVILMSILLVVFFSFTPAFGQPKDANKVQPQDVNKVQPIKPAKELEHKKIADANKAAGANVAADANKAADTNKAADANAIADPNAVRAEIGKFEGLGEALKQVNIKSGNEIGEWTKGKLDDRLNLALASQKQITAELKLLREIASKEGAAKTTAAIDGILLDRQERFKSVIEKLEKDNRWVIEREEKRKELRERSIGRNKERTDRTKKDLQQ
jgi:hypothetical protein